MYAHLIDYYFNNAYICHMAPIKWRLVIVDVKKLKEILKSKCLATHLRQGIASWMRHHKRKKASIGSC